MLILTSLNIAWQIKVLDYHIYLLIFVSWITFVIVWMSLVFIRWASLFWVQMTKKFYIGAFYLHIKWDKIIVGIILLFLANLTFQNYTKKLLEKNQSFLILESDDVDDMDLLKNSTIEILNENYHFKWSVDKNGKIIDSRNKIEGNYRVENLLVKENSSLMLYYEKNRSNFEEENGNLNSQKGEYVDLKNNVVKIFEEKHVKFHFFNAIPTQNPYIPSVISVNNSHFIQCPNNPNAVPLNFNLLPSNTVCFASHLYFIVIAHGKQMPNVRVVTKKPKILQPMS